MIDITNLTPAQLRKLSEQATAEAARLRKAGSEELRRRLEAIAAAEGYAVRVQFVSHRKGRRQAELPLADGPAPLPEPIKPRPVPLPQPKPYSGAAMARELAAVGLEAGAVDDRIDAGGGAE